MKKKLLFITGTRADYGKQKSIIKKSLKEFDVTIFVTGMHMLSKYGATYLELEKDNFAPHLYKFVNQHSGNHMDEVLSNTLKGISDYVKEFVPDMIIIHGDRVEALAGAMSGAFNNIKVLHIEGGEVSGTIDESIRHAITKFSQIHLVSNKEAVSRIIRMGENPDLIFNIGSPDIDIMLSENLPSLESVKKHYNICFDEYAILLYHPVTTDLIEVEKESAMLVDSLIDSGHKYVVIEPNNDKGSDIVLKNYKRLHSNSNFKIFPSISFESFLTLFKYTSFIIGNSSAGVRESSVYGTPAINIGTRQNGRTPESSKNIINIKKLEKEILLSYIDTIKKYKQTPISYFGKGDSSQKFIEILNTELIWTISNQKVFFD